MSRHRVFQISIGRRNQLCVMSIAKSLALLSEESWQRKIVVTVLKLTVLT